MDIYNLLTSNNTFAQSALPISSNLRKKNLCPSVGIKSVSIRGKQKNGSPSEAVSIINISDPKNLEPSTLNFES